MKLSTALFSFALVSVSQCSQLATYKCNQIEEAFTDPSSDVQLILENVDLECRDHVKALRKWKDSLNVSYVLRLTRPEIKTLKVSSLTKRKKRVASMCASFKKRTGRDLSWIQVPARTSQKVLNTFEEVGADVELLPCESDESESEESVENENVAELKPLAAEEDEFDDYEIVQDDDDYSDYEHVNPDAEKKPII